VLWAGGGEAVGFAVPALVGAGVGATRPALLLPALVVAGAGEGAVLGWAQSRVLVGVGVDARRWTALTAVAAAAAWFLGMGFFGSDTIRDTWPVPALLVGSVLVGAAVLLSIGLAQALELRRVVDRAGRWVGANVLAWTAGLAVFGLVTTPLWQSGQEPWTVLLIGLLGGVLMALTMALVTGLVLVRLLRRTR
jgi:uncharacterized integral membrane protein